MTFVDSIITPAPNITNSLVDSYSVLICSIIFNNNKYVVEGQKFGTQGIYWEIDGLGFVMTSNKTKIIFSIPEFDTLEMTETFTMWHETGIELLN